MGMFDFLPDATSFVGMEVKQKPSERYPGMDGMDNLCPVCNGYGGWNLKVDAYGEGKHFNSHCIQCNGWGWVKQADSDCIHVWKTKWIAMHDRQDTCQVCGQVRVYDTSG